MPPKPWAVPKEAVGIYQEYLDWLQRRGVGSKPYFSAA